MQIHDHIHGFTVTASRPLPELNATLWEMTYDKNGAQLCWLQREDKTKTFAIAFKTIPSDDTGVFHILEHSVLCGSDKFPSKEPFVELLKGSLQTFLNAMTFPDKTMYPVSSRNDRDFLNLTDVYMDAVLHPAIYHKPEIFRQEGWHYAIEEGDPAYNGVVFNEMKGAYSDVETVMYQEITRLLFPGQCYGFSSGGDPEHIPELTYEQFIHCHQTYYHPSNARIFLDGAVVLEDTLALLDGYLKDYDRLELDHDIPLQPPVPYAEVTRPYEVAPDADDDRMQLCWGYVYGTFAQRERAIAVQILTDVLCGSNEAPLKKAVLSAGLAEDIYFQMDDGTKQQLLLLEMRNVEADRVAEARELLKTTLTGLKEAGLDREQLTASLNRLEFRARAKDFGSYPRGLIYAMSSMESWLYDGDPAQNLCHNELFASLRQKLDTDYYEQVLNEVLLCNPHCASLCLTPSATLGEEKRQKEAARLAAAAAGWTPEQRETLIAEEQALHRAQATPDTPELLATLPQLSLEDVEGEPEVLPIQVLHTGGGTVLLHEVDTDGIVYADMYFNASGLTPDELSCASLLCDMLGSAATARHTRLSLQTAIRTHLGGLSFSPTAFTRNGEAKNATPYLTVSVQLLESKKAEAISLIAEILGSSDLDDTELLLQLLRQQKLADEESLTTGGHRYALGRIAAACTAEGAIQEYFDGFENCLWVRRTEAAFAEKAEALCAQLKAIAARVFTRERLTVSVTGKPDETFCRALLSTVAVSGCAVPPADIQPMTFGAEGILIPSGVSYAVKGTHLSRLNAAYTGTLRVAANLVSLSYLWNNVRVQGGAYGSGFVTRPNGVVGMYSYRDPQPARSLGCYDKAADFLEAFCNSDESLTPYIIGTVADTDPLLTPRSKGQSAAVRYLTGRSHEDVCRLRAEILGTTKEQLAALCPLLRAMAAESSVCVIGGQAGLDACGDRLLVIRSLQEKGE